MGGVAAEQPGPPGLRRLSGCLRRLGGAPTGAVGLGSQATAGAWWLVAQFPAPLKGASLEPPATMHPHLPTGGRGRGPVRRMPVA
ncbi:hypothetical protein GCM10023080_010790 [Streptomyces pseudoechinosporeus]